MFSTLVAVAVEAGFVVFDDVRHLSTDEDEADH